MSLLPSDPQPRELKPEQKTAAHTLDRHLSVTAGPGSGKTTVLVERYLEILRTQKVSVDNIVAITFTNRAANEMRQRVRTKIDALLRETSGNERQTWLRHKRALEAAVVTTIHGFCSRLLHEFPVEANIDPQFALLDEHQSAMMLEAVVEQALTDAIHHGNEKIVLMTQGATRAVLASALVELYRRYRGEGLSLEAIEKLSARNHAADAEYAAAFKALEAAMADLIAARGLSRDAERKRGKAAQEWPALRQILSRPPTDATIAAYCQGIEDLWEARPRKGSTPVIERLDELLWDAKSSDRLRGRVPCLGFDLLAKDYALALIKLLREIDRRLEVEKQRLSVLDFDDLQLRTLQVLERPEVLTRVTERYRFFLVDEFQDTNGLQRDLMNRLALGRGANLFIVGDRKQSVYGFRGADVDVFSEMTAAIVKAGGAPQPLQLNFRSQKPLIDSYNFLFARIFTARAEVPAAELGQLGFVEHEPSVAERAAAHKPPLVELMVSILSESKTSAAESEEGAEESDPLGAQERDAEQVAARIRSLVSGPDFSPGNQASPDSSPGNFRYGDIAILLRAFTGVWTYESALRRAGIPYLTVQGKGFYQREEITDLIQLLRFLDNTTDELALSAVLRSPLGGISDNALLALRCAPRVTDVGSSERLHRRNLRRALRSHREIQFIDEADHAALDRVSEWLDLLIRRRNRYSISELLRFAVSSSEFTVVIAANFDGAQRVANVEKLFRLAEQFEKSGYLIRDFVHYVEEFEAIGGRESEGQMDESANVVRLMTIHQAKGLEFPVVIVPDLHREQRPRDAWYALDRHKGFSVRVPDGRGQAVRGSLFNQLRQRARWREEFESMRLLYVAATRAEDRLILSGAVAQKELKNLAKTEREQWLAWIWQALELTEHPQSGVLAFGEDVEIQLTVDREAQTLKSSNQSFRDAEEPEEFDSSRPIDELFPLLQPVKAERGQALRRFSVTQLINFQRCTRQYYFDRMLRAPGAEERAIWNDAEAPEPPANLTATLKGAVIHRFCETFRQGDDPGTRLRTSFNQVVAQRQAELAGRVFEIDPEEAVLDLMPLAENYLASEVFQRVKALDRFNAESANPQSAIRNSKSLSPGLWSELRFRLRRPWGILTGTIDKLLITPAADGNGIDVEVIDFKTNRFSRQVVPQENRARSAAVTAGGRGELKTENRSQPAQGLFDFESVPEDVASEGNKTSTDSEVSFTAQAEMLARDYQLQMQAYALALRELLPNEVRVNSLRATLHFIEPNLEVALAPELLEHDTCVRIIDYAMLQIAALDGTLDAELFPPLPATHCRMCNFLELCPAGREGLRQN
ncbi:MAG TPA: UvrD-helicase domain-containing protein [Pyrinomonadaceae bacterium]|nr:UvrD-helicase domain-containing protein [Pyrinomonadaceae bacterium]